MRQYVIGFLSFFDNELQMEVVDAESPEDAVLNCSFVKGFEFPEGATLDNMEELIFGCDAVISVLGL